VHFAQNPLDIRPWHFIFNDHEQPVDDLLEIFGILDRRLRQRSSAKDNVAVDDGVLLGAYLANFCLNLAVSKV
jgi:hypothetical protein